MKKITPLLFVFFLLGSSVSWGQSDNLLVVMECQGKIKYYAPDGSKPMNVIPGVLLAPEGVLNMKKGASLQVQNGMSVIAASQAGKAPVQDLIPPAAQAGRFGFGGDFLAMVSNTMNAAGKAPASLTGKKGAGGEETPPPTTGKKGAGGEEVPPPTTGKKGAGGEETPPPTTGKKGMGYGLSMLNWNFPVKGKMYVTEPIPFSWEGHVKEEGPWTFSIVKKGEDKPTFEAETTEPFLSLNTVQARLAIGNSYSWRITGKDNRWDILKAFEFSLVQEHMEKGILEVVEAEPEYQTAGPVQKLLWEAFAYEEAGFLMKANGLYKEAIRLEPDNWLAVQLYAAFWGRNW